MSLEKNEQFTLQNAINTSRAEDRIVTLDWDSGAIDAAIDWITATYEGDVDSVENGEVTEIWGWTDDMPEAATDFRVHLRMIEGLAGE